MSDLKPDNDIEFSPKILAEHWLRQGIDPDYIKNLESKLGVLTEFVLLTRQTKKAPRWGLLVASRHLRSSFKVIPCIRIKVVGAANEKGYDNGCSIEISAGIVYRELSERRFPLAVLTEQTWVRRLWVRNWGENWEKGREDGWATALAKMRGWAPVWHCSGQIYRWGKWAKAKAYLSEEQYLAIMLLLGFWEKNKTKARARAADLLALDLITEKDAHGNVAILCKRAGAKLGGEANWRLRLLKTSDKSRGKLSG